jgi:hypothetical protein
LSKAKSGRNHWNFGKHHSKQTRLKIAKALTGEKNVGFGKFRNAATRTKMVQHHAHYWRGKHLSKSHIANISRALAGKNGPRYGITPSISCGRCRHYYVQGIHCQGTYELRFVRACFKWGVPVRNVVRRLRLCDSKGDFTYLPDFKIPGRQGFVEIKGKLYHTAHRKIVTCIKAGIPIHVMTLKYIKHFEHTGELTFYPQHKLLELVVPDDSYGIDLDKIPYATHK